MCICIATESQRAPAHHLLEDEELKASYKDWTESNYLISHIFPRVWLSVARFMCFCVDSECVNVSTFTVKDGCLSLPRLPKLGFDLAPASKRSFRNPLRETETRQAGLCSAPMKAASGSRPRFLTWQVQKGPAPVCLQATVRPRAVARPLLSAAPHECPSHKQDSNLWPPSSTLGNWRQQPVSWGEREQGHFLSGSLSVVFVN